MGLFFHAFGFLGEIVFKDWYISNVVVIPLTQREYEDESVSECSIYSTSLAVNPENKWIKPIEFIGVIRLMKNQIRLLIMR